MIPQKTIEDLINKHSVLEKDLSTGKIDKKNLTGGGGETLSNPLPPGRLTAVGCQLAVLFYIHMKRPQVAAALTSDIAGADADRGHEGIW